MFSSVCASCCIQDDVIVKACGAQLQKIKKIYINGANHFSKFLGAEVAQRANNEGFEIKRANSISFFPINYKVLALRPGLFRPF